MWDQQLLAYTNSEKLLGNNLNTQHLIKANKDVDLEINVDKPKRM
jgi:hypothetical protein